jgi:hypothetical protein
MRVAKIGVLQRVNVNLLVSGCSSRSGITDADSIYVLSSFRATRK